MALPSNLLAKKPNARDAGTGHSTPVSIGIRRYEITGPPAIWALDHQGGLAATSHRNPVASTAPATDVENPRTPCERIGGRNSGKVLASTAMQPVRPSLRSSKNCTARWVCAGREHLSTYRARSKQVHPRFRRLNSRPTHEWREYAPANWKAPSNPPFIPPRVKSSRASLEFRMNSQSIQACSSP